MKNFKTETVRYYFVGGFANNQVWGKNKAEILKFNPELKGKKLVFNRSEKRLIQD